MALLDPFLELSKYSLDSFDLILDHLKNTFTIFANHYFNQNKTTQSHDKFFNYFIPLSEDLYSQRKYSQAMKLWEYALDLAHNWEKTNRPIKIHKGAPYYFLGVTAILNNDLENGFLAMHQALKEDYRLTQSETPQKPAYWFVTLDSPHGHFFDKEVKKMSDYLLQKLEKYRLSRGGTLQIKAFRNKFLRCKNLTNEVFFFVYLLSSLKKLEDETQAFKRNSFSSIIYINLLFDLCRTLERVIENKNPAAGTGFISFYKEVLFLSEPSTHITSLSFTRNQLGKINGRFNKAFNKTMYDILKGRYLKLRTDNEKDFAIAYGIRNSGAHDIRNLQVIYNRFPELAQNILNAFFLTIEKLY